MVKKINLIYLAFILAIVLQGCFFDDPKYVHIKEKGSLNYYSNEVYNKILLGEEYTIEVFYTDITEAILIDETESKVIEDFFSSLEEKNFKEYKDIKEVEPYQIRIKFKAGDKYIIKIYDEERVAVFPWDGTFKEDIIDMKGVPLRYNLYDFCKTVEERKNYMQ